jgi:glutamyl-tRNA reductase
MNSTFKALSISYKTTSVQIREQLALNETLCRSLLFKIKETLQVENLLILSTCNRTEIYYSADKDLSEVLLKLLLIEKGILDFDVNSLVYLNITDPVLAVKALFRVSMGLESQVVGDLQISNQVKRAYQYTADAEMAGTFLHRLMHSIFFTNKRIVQETSFRDGAASVSYATAELVNELLASYHNPKILAIGAGEIGADTLRNLHGMGIENLTIANRTLEKAESLAKECGAQVLPFEELWEGIQNADVIISSVPVAKFITYQKVQAFDILSFKHFIDLSMPRSIEEKINEITGVLLYNIDQIHSRTEATLQKRKAAVPEVEAIIDEAITDFSTWTQEMVFSPTIHRLKNMLEQIRKEEMARYVREMDEKQLKKMDKLTKGMMQKVLKLPIVQLKAACKRGEAENLVGVLNDLFNLENVEEKS